jgi:copper transport protein
LLGSRPLRRLVLGGFGALAILTVTAAPAAAHAALIGTSPSQSAHYPADAPPKTVTVAFDDDVTTTPKSIGVYDGAGHAVPVVPVHTADEKLVEADLPKLAQGNYAVVWHIVSDDGHPETGAFTFSVGAAGAATADLHSLEASRTSGRGIGVGFGLVRGLEYFACLVLVGALFFVRWRWPVALSRRNVRRFLITVAGIGVLTTVASISFEAAYSNGSGSSALFDGSALGDVVSARFGTAALVRAGLLVALAVYALVPIALKRRGTRIVTELPLALLGLGVAATFAYAGHGFTGRWPVAGFALDTAHITAAAVWLGGLVLLAMAIRRPADPRDSARALGRFSRIALPAIAVVVLSGVVQGWREIDTWSALWHTSYGRLLLVKVLVVVAIVIVASAGRDALRDRRLARSDDEDDLPPLGSGGGRPSGYNQPPAGREPATAHALDAGTAHVDVLDMPPDPDDLLARDLRNGMLVEVGLAVVVLAVTSALVVTPPSREAVAAAKTPQAQTVHVAANGKTVGYQVAVQPTLVGQNTIVIDPHLTGSGLLPTAVTGEARAVGGTARSRLNFTALPNGKWVAVGSFSVPGAWTVQIDGATPATSEATAFRITIR